MALFAGEPAGIQIRKWLTVLVLLIALVNGLAAGTLFVLQRSVAAIRQGYQPVLLAAGEIAARVCQAQVALYQYLGEYQENTDEVERRTAVLETAVEEALALEAARQWEGQLTAIKDGLARYRVAVRSLPPIGAGTDWQEVDELRAQAVALGRTMEEQAAELKAQVGVRIGEKADRSLWLSRAAAAVFLCLLGLSAVITLLLVAWWRQFQDMILNL